jgi:hypothetical protein
VHDNTLYFKDTLGTNGPGNLAATSILNCIEFASNVIKNNRGPVSSKVDFVGTFLQANTFRGCLIFLASHDVFLVVYKEFTTWQQSSFYILLIWLTTEFYVLYCDWFLYPTWLRPDWLKNNAIYA